MFDQNEAECPRCGEVWEVDPRDLEYEQTPDIYCPDCDLEITGMMQGNTDFWYDASEARFAELYLRLRGYWGKPKSWYAVGAVLNLFKLGQKTIPNGWKNQECFEEARRIVTEYYEKEIVLCEHWDRNNELCFEDSMCGKPNYKRNRCGGLRIYCTNPEYKNKEETQ